jgi:hypothetical protein
VREALGVLLVALDDPARHAGADRDEVDLHDLDSRAGQSP